MCQQIVILKRGAIEGLELLSPYFRFQDFHACFYYKTSGLSARKLEEVS
jgi:hypothetical protein